MYKKILTLIFAAVVSVSALCIQPVLARGKLNSYEKQTDLLMALNIINKAGNTNDKVTREEFFSSMLHMIMEDENIYSVEEQAAAEGLTLSGSSIDFAGSLYISYNDAIEAAVKTLGYNIKAVSNGGYPYGYIAAASELGITEGVAGERTTPMTRENVNRLLYNMLSVAPMCEFYDGAAKRVQILKNETILSVSRGIYEISGLVTGNSTTSIYNNEGSYRDMVTIDSVHYYIGESNADSMLGLYVDAYIQKKSNLEEETIIYIVPRESKNTELVLKAESIESVDENYTYIEYRTDGSGVYKKAKIDRNIKVIYNGKFYGSYTAEDFKPPAGEIKLVDNTNDGIYDVAFITAYETIVVGNVSFITGMVYNKYTFDTAINQICLDPDQADEEINIYFNGEKSDFSKIKENDVLSVQRTKGDGKQTITVYISRVAINGQCSLINRENSEITIGDEVYPVADELFTELDKSGKTLQLSVNYDFLIDISGRIVYAKKNVSSDYCMFYKAYEEEGLDSDYAVNYMDSDSAWKTTHLASKVKYGGTSLSKNIVFNQLVLLEPQIVILKTNASGEINEIMPAVTGSYGSADFIRTAEQTLTYRSTPRAFNCTIYPDDEAKVFIMPSQSTDKSDYYVTTMSYFLGDTEYTIAAYDLDEFGFANVIAVMQSRDSLQRNVNNGLFLVTKMGEKVVDDEILTYVQGAMGKYTEVELVGKDSDIFNQIKKGDVINIHVNRDNRVDLAVPVFRISDGFVSQAPAENYLRNAVITGVISAVSAENKRMKIQSDREIAYRLESSLGITIYHAKTNKCEAGAIGDLSINDKVICRTTWGALQELIIVAD